MPRCPACSVLIGTCLLALPGLTWGQLSDGMRERILFRLPAYDPAVPRPAKIERPAPADDVTVLPDFEVLEKRPRKIEPDDLMTSDELTKKAIRAFSRDRNPLELALARIHIPFLTASFAERARAAYRGQREMERDRSIFHLADVISRFDRKDAANLRAAMDPGKLPRAGQR